MAVALVWNRLCRSIPVASAARVYVAGMSESIARSSLLQVLREMQMHVTRVPSSFRSIGRPVPVARSHTSQFARRNPRAPGRKIEAQNGWPLEGRCHAAGVKELPVKDIRRPLALTRTNDTAKVEALMESIKQHGLKEPIDVLEVEGKIYGFSGCHRYEAFQRLGKETIPCRVRKATQKTLQMHLM